MTPHRRACRVVEHKLPTVQYPSRDINISFCCNYCFFLSADSNASRDKLCLKNDQDVLRQISREAELKQCFREREAALQALTDTMQLQNCELKRDIEQLHVRLNKETEAKSNLESSLDVSETKLSEAICKYERLQSDFISLGEESKETINKINEDKKSVDEALKIAQADWNAEIAHFKKTNKDLLEKLRYDKGDETRFVLKKNKDPFMLTKTKVIRLLGY